MLEFKKFDNGFEYIQIINDLACANIALQGAHVFHYALRDQTPILWLSDSSDFSYEKAIRGGVPICWPSFGMNNTSLPQHGFARVSMFELVSHNEIDSTKTELVFSLEDSAESLKLWRYKFRLELKISISDKLEMELKTINTDTKEFKITQALHTYLNVSDISNILVKGLNNKPRFDALTNKKFIHKEDIIFKEEFDSVFQEVDGEIDLIDKTREINIHNEGSSSVVVWNPWIAKSARMSGMKEQAYKEFVCIESANAFEDFKIIQPQQSHTLKAIIKST
jgi:glucose-6-phosphate 1-epimerase